MELTYEYNFEWYYGGANVRCLCGAANYSLFLGAKCRRFREYNHVWEDGDDRYIVDDLPVYDSTDDESTLVICRTSGGNEHTKILNDGEGSTFKWEPTNSATKKSQRKPKLKRLKTTDPGWKYGKEQARPIRPQLSVNFVKKLLMAESFVTNNTLLVLAGTSHDVNNARML
uniref:Putative ovule protein n=1 Tax=Solanum chacoense TaxID=4108 RepID=A0A0V0I6Q1_SOLCH